MRYIFALFFLASSVFGIKYDISTTEIKNANTAIIKFEKNINVYYETVEYLEQKYKIFNNYVLIPISYYQKPRLVELKVTYRDYGKRKSETIKIKVIDGKYKQETLKVQKSKVILSAKNKKRASKEYKAAYDIYNTTTPKNLVTKKYIMPLDTKITSLFGNARVYNGTLKGYHSGTDFRAKVGTPLKTVNDGVVVLVQDRFYSGGSVIIDHGRGIYLCYYHMSRFDVKVGDEVKQGDIIGLSGDTGRVTGPHLHFSARVGAVQVDPMQLMRLLNKNIKEIN